MSRLPRGACALSQPVSDLALKYKPPLIFSPYAPHSAIMLTDLGNYAEGCPATPAAALGDPDALIDAAATGEAICKSQESSLALLWTLGVFALNCGPVLMGFVLDYLGPKFTALLGSALNVLGLVLFAVSSSSGTDAFIAAAVILGLGNITFHLAQFHVSALFPRKRGLVTSAFVAGFTGSGIVMYLLLLIFQDAGSTVGAYRGVLLGYAGLVALWAPLVAWTMPYDSFRVGMVYLLRDDWRFDVRQRSEMERMYRRATTLQDFVAAASAAGGTDGAVAGAAAYMYGDDEGGGGGGGGGGRARGNGALIGGGRDSSDPVWSALDAAEEQRRQRQRQQQQQWGGGDAAGEATALAEGSGEGDLSPTAGVAGGAGAGAPGRSPSPSPGPPPPGPDGAAPGPESMPLPPDVVWGPLVFESRRFVELRKRPFRDQFLSTESFGMGLFYTLNVFFMQFYLGTQRLQLDYKGDSNNAFSNFGNVVVAFAFVAIPLIAWLLDKKGYGWTLGTINALAVLTSLMQALPALWVQAATLVVWMVARFFMYSSYFAIFGGLFGFRNFGRLVAIDNTFNGLFGLLQYPLTYAAIHGLDGNFTLINVLQAVALLPLFAFCYYMGRWEREDLVPIRPMEGEELPCDMVGARERKKLRPLHLPHIELPAMPGLPGRRPPAAAADRGSDGV